ncbi:MAG: hypothetical protein ACK58T_49095 [Phycisphaerae bacterium]
MFRVPIDQHAASNQIGQHAASASAFAVAESFAQTLMRDALQQKFKQSQSAEMVRLKSTLDASSLAWPPVLSTDHDARSVAADTKTPRPYP